MNRLLSFFNFMRSIFSIPPCSSERRKKISLNIKLKGVLKMNIVHPIKNISKINQIKNILKNRSNRNCFLFELGINTGLRISDLLKLKVSDIKNKTHITIIEQKTGKYKKFLINDSLRKKVNDYTASMSSDMFLFSSRNCLPVKRHTAYKIIKQAARDAGIKDKIGTHTLRKTFGYHLYQKTKDVAMLQRIFNHSSPDTTMCYIDIQQDYIDEVLSDFSL